MSSRTLVLGATGKVGREVVRGLLARGAQVKAATRHPGTPPSEWAGEAAAVEFDYDRPATFDEALESVDRLFLVVRPGDERPDETAVPFLDEAARRGIRRVVTLTAMGVERLEENGLRKIEWRVERSAVEWTHLRPNFFMQIFSVPPLIDQIDAGVLRLPVADARLSFVDVRDIAAVAVTALLDEGHAGRAYTLTGGEAIDHAAVADAISQAAGRPVRYEAIAEDAARRLMAASGLNAERSDRLLRFYRLVRAGACAPVSGDIQAVLGRATVSFERFVRDHAACWRRPVAAPTA